MTVGLPELFFPRNLFQVVTDAGSLSIPESDFSLPNRDIINRLSTNDTYSTYNNLHKLITTVGDGVLYCFSNLTIFYPTEITPGSISAIDQRELFRKHGRSKDEYSLIAAAIPTAVMGNLNNDEHVFIVPISTNEDYISIGTTYFRQQDKSFQPTIVITLFYARNNDALWKKALYRSLFEYGMRNFTISLILLFASLDILTRELSVNREEVRISTRIHTLRKQVKSKDATLYKRLGTAKRQLESKLIELRGDAAHRARDVHPDELRESFAAVFSFLWELPEIVKNVD